MNNAKKRPEKAENTTENPEHRQNPKGGESAPRPDPVRYGDWEKDGRCIDF